MIVQDMPPFFDQGRRKWRRSDKVVRLVVGNWALGMAAGAVISSAMIALDVLGLHTLMRHAHTELVGSILLIAGFSFTFGGVIAAAAAMRAGQDEDDDPRGGLRAPALAYAAIRAAR